MQREGEDMCPYRDLARPCTLAKLVEGRRIWHMIKVLVLSEDVIRSLLDPRLISGAGQESTDAVITEDP